MKSAGDDANKFILELIEAGGWKLRYSPRGFPYAALPEGFGNGESGVKLHFVPYNSNIIKVYGVIEFSEEIKVRRPVYRVFVHKGTDEAVKQIKQRLLPKYKQ